jgi:hypothetical protein
VICRESRTSRALQEMFVRFECRMILWAEPDHLLCCFLRSSTYSEDAVSKQIADE